jgi:hypothetical protein
MYLAQMWEIETANDSSSLQLVLATYTEDTLGA